MGIGKIAIALLALGCAQQGQASVCSETSELVQDSQNYFRDLRGAYDPDLEEYAATKLLPGASECVIQEDEYGGRYQCRWQFAGSDESSARQASAAMTTDVRDCFPDATTRDYQNAQYRSQKREFKLDRQVSVQVGLRYHEYRRDSRFNRWIVDLVVKANKP